MRCRKIGFATICHNHAARICARARGMGHACVCVCVPMCPSACWAARWHTAASRTASIWIAVRRSHTMRQPTSSSAASSGPVKPANAHGPPRVGWAQEARGLLYSNTRAYRPSIQHGSGAEDRKGSCTHCSETAARRVRRKPEKGCYGCPANLKAPGPRGFRPPLQSIEGAGLANRASRSVLPYWVCWLLHQYRALPSL